MITVLPASSFMIGKMFARLFRYTQGQYYQQWWRHHQNPRWPPKTKIVIVAILFMAFGCPRGVDAAQKISRQYLFWFPNWNVPKLRSTCFAYWRQTRSRSVFYVTPANLRLISYLLIRNQRNLWRFSRWWPFRTLIYLNRKWRHGDVIGALFTSRAW